jgi:hypothetical protein
MSNTNTGGPAFAHQLESNRDGYAITGGMTLRDYFAAKAMQGYLAQNKAYDFEDIAAVSFRMADAMLKAREA